MPVLTLGLWIIYVVACLGCGSLLRRLLAGKAEAGNQHSVWVEITTAFLLGQGLLANIWLLLALGAQFSPLIVWLVIAIAFGCAGFAWPLISRLARQLRSTLLSFRGVGLAWLGVACLILLLLLLEAIGALVLAPRGDTAAFYMVLPKVVAASHQLVPLRGLESLAQLGLQGEMHHAALILLGSDRAAKLFVWCNSLVVAVMLLAICIKAGVGRRGQLIALAILFTSSAFILIIPDGKVDLFAAAMGMGAFYWALVAADHNGGPPLRLAGLFTGLAVIAKISYFLPLVSGVVLLVVWRRFIARQERQSGESFISWVIAVLVPLGLWMALPVLPHLFKNGVLFGEPLAPLFSSRGLGGLEQAWFTPDVTRWIVLTYPLALIFGEYPIQGGTLSALILIFAPLILLLPQPQSLARQRLFQITLAAVLGTALWVAARPSILAPRYLLASLLLFVPLVARGAEYISDGEKRPRLISAGIWLSTFVCLLLTLAMTLSYLKLRPAAVLMYAAGRLPECAVSGPECPALTIVNQEAQSGERVYLATHFEYSLRPDLIQCAPGADERLTIMDLQTPEARWSYLHEQGFGYVVIDETTHATTVAALDTQHVPDGLAVTWLLSDNNYRVFRLESRDPNRQSKMLCRQVKAPAWQVTAR